MENLKRELSLGGSSLKGVQREVKSMGATTAETSLTRADSGALILLDSTAAQIQVINLPTVLAADVGMSYEFVVLATGNGGAAGSYTINTGGHASDATATPTKGYDDFIGTLNVVDTAAVTAADKTVVTPAGGEGAMVLADNTANAGIAVGTHFRCTAVAASTIGTAGGNTWLIEGRILTADATGFVTAALFTAP